MKREVRDGQRKDVGVVGNRRWTWFSGIMRKHENQGSENERGVTTNVRRAAGYLEWDITWAEESVAHQCCVIIIWLCLHPCLPTLNVFFPFYNQFLYILFSEFTPFAFLLPNSPRPLLPITLIPFLEHFLPSLHVPRVSPKSFPSTHALSAAPPAR